MFGLSGRRDISQVSLNYLLRYLIYLCSVRAVRESPVHEIRQRYVVPEARVVEFYRRFGEFLASGEGTAGEATPGLGGGPILTPVDRRAPAWIEDPGAVDRVALLWSYLSEAAQGTFRVLIEGALAEEPRRFTPSDIVEATGNPNGVSGVAGVFGAAGRAIRKAQLPRYPDGQGEDWHFVWNWDGREYWMVPEVAALLRTAQ